MSPRDKWYISWVIAPVTARIDGLILFWATIEITSHLFQKSTDDMSAPKHHSDGKVSLHTGAPAPAPAIKKHG